MDNRMDEKDAELLRSRSRAAFDAQAPTYDTGMEGDHARRLYPHVLAEVARAVAGNPAPRLLDLGCGTGALAELALGEIPGALLSCVDLSPRMAEAARERLGGRVDVLLYDAEHLPFRDGSFDVIPSMYFSPIAQTDRPRVRKRTFTTRANGPSPLPASRRPSSPAAGPSACTTCP